MIGRAAVLTAAVLLLAGCTAAPEPVVTPTPTEAALPAPAVGIVGTGTLNGEVFEISWDGYEFALTGLDDLPQTTVQVSAAEAVVGECTPGFAMWFGGPFEVPMQVAVGVVVARDPTFLTSVSTVGPYLDDCYGQHVLSTTTIDWSMEPTYSDLVVIDSGDTGGAKGIVTLEGAVPVSYQVNQGDVLAEIAARFGLTSDQLVWLNPRRDTPDTVFKDETLNLSPSAR